MLLRLIKLIASILRQEHYEDTLRGLYVNEHRPKTYGTLIRRKNDYE